MKFKELRPMMWTEQLEETIAFYTEILGFTLGEKNDDWGWAAMHRDNVEIMIAKPNAHITFEVPLFTGSFYYNIDNVEKFWESIKEKVKVVYPIENFPWGMREFSIYDNNGYILQFGQDMDE